MIIRTGVDLVDLNRFYSVLQLCPRIGDFVKSDLEKQMDLSPLQIAENFCAKEALYKALQNIPFAFREVCLTENVFGAPVFVFLSSKLRGLSISSISLSISHDKSSLISIVTLIIPHTF